MSEHQLGRVNVVLTAALCSGSLVLDTALEVLRVTMNEMYHEILQLQPSHISHQHNLTNISRRSH